MNLVVPFVFRRFQLLEHLKLESRSSLSETGIPNLLQMISVALVEPEIPPNTGNIARLCAAARVPLHIVGVTGFRLDDKAVRRAGLDYWSEVIIHRHANLERLNEFLPDARFLYLTTKADKSYTEWAFSGGDCLVFGRETRGLPEQLLSDNWDRCLTVPILNPKVRSLNLATAVAIVLYEALRQTGALKTPNQLANINGTSSNFSF